MAALSRRRRRRCRALLLGSFLSLSGTTYLCYSLLLFCCAPEEPEPAPAPRPPDGTTSDADAAASCLPAAPPARKKLLQKSPHHVSACRAAPSSVNGSSLAAAASSAPPGILLIPARSSGGVKRLPHAIIVGVKKGGTRAVLEFIRGHPAVRALGTEPHFFDRHYGRGLQWYR